MERERAEGVMRIARTVFLGTFAALTVIGMLPDRERSYIPVKNTDPVFFHTIDVENSESSGKLTNDIYVMSNAATELPAVSAQGAALLSLDTGELIYGKNSDVVLPMASTTKIMTALVVLDSGKALDEIFTVPREAVGVEGSSVYLFEGEKITVRDLLYGLLLESGNDAATALAICCSGSVESFVSQMNKKASELGLYRTQFENPHGLSAQNHKTTAYELGRITYAAMQNETFREIVSTKSYNSTPVSAEFPSHYFVNHNRMLRTFEGANGVKTGYTIASGRCLVTGADRGNGGFIAVTLNDRNDWKDHAAMHEYGFANYKAVTAAEAGEIEFLLDGKVYSNKERLSAVLGKEEARFGVEGELKSSG